MKTLFNPFYLTSNCDVFYRDEFYKYVKNIIKNMYKNLYFVFYRKYILNKIRITYLIKTMLVVV